MTLEILFFILFMIFYKWGPRIWRLTIWRNQHVKVMRAKNAKIMA
jgi:hypothetical protein